MNFQEFLTNYDVPESIILLEGKRDVLGQDADKLVSLGKLLASSSKYIIFRSGNAGGSDQLFAEGVVLIDPNRIEVITPYSGHRKSANKSFRTYTLDDLNLASEPEVVQYSLTNKSTQNLINKYVNGKRDKFSMKAAYIIRDTIKVVGATGILPSTFGIFYDDLNNPKKGGTGHTMHVCELNKVPFID